MVQPAQDPSGGSQQPLSQEDLDAALKEAGLNPAAPADTGTGVAGGGAESPATAGQAVSPTEATHGPSSDPSSGLPVNPSEGAIVSGSPARPLTGQPAVAPNTQVADTGPTVSAKAAASSAAQATSVPLGHTTAHEAGAGRDGPVPADIPDFAGGNGNGKGKAVQLDKLQMLEDVQLQVRIELGRTRMLVQDVLRLDQGSVVELDKLAGDPVDVYVNERLVARGEVLVLNDNFCVRVNEIVSTPQETVA